jgi:hypothetical protein
VRCENSGGTDSRLSREGQINVISRQICSARE